MFVPTTDSFARLINRERLFVRLRFGALLLLLAVLALDPQSRASPALTLYIVAAGILLNSLAWLLLRWRRFVAWIAIASSVGEGLFFLYFLIASGGSQSALWAFVFVLIAATALRHGTRGGVLTAAVFSLITFAYATLSTGLDALGMYQSIVRTLAFIGMALMVGWVIRYEQAQSQKESEQTQQALQVTQSEVDALAQLSGTISSQTDYQVALQATLDLSIRSLQTRSRLADKIAAMILLFDQAQDGALFVAAQRNLPSADETRRLKPIDGAIKTVLSTVEPVFLRDAKQDPLLGQFDALDRSSAAFILPLRASLTLYGVVVYAGSARLLDIFRGRVELMEAYATQAAIAVRNAQLYAQARAERDRIVDGEENARHELARDLHDGPINAVALLAMGIDFARRLLDENPLKAREQMDAMQRLATKTARDMRTTMYRLRPLALESAGLSVAVQQYIARLQAERKQPQIHFTASDPQTFESRLAPNAATIVFDVISEAVGNALKHAEAQNVWISLQMDGDWLIASVTDDGKGFDVAAVMNDYAARGSLGMVNIHERAELAQGNARIESAPGRGATVTVQVPLSR